MVLNVVLVGSNPLPCYIQIAYLLNEKRADKNLLAIPDKYLFVYSKETNKYYENICYVLREEGFNIDDDVNYTLNLDKDSRDGYKIENGIKEKLREIKKENSLDEIIINFTGGTKVMSVYATNAIRNFCSQDKSNIKYTEVYVDSIKNKIRFNSKIREETILEDKLPRECDLRKYVYISMDNLIKLHYGKNCKIEFESKYGSKIFDKNTAYDNTLDDAINEFSKNIFYDKDSDYREYIEYIKFCLNFENIKIFNKIYKSKINSIKSEITSNNDQNILEKLYSLEFNEEESKKIKKKMSSKSNKICSKFFLDKTNEYINFKKEIDKNYNIDYIPKELNIIELSKEKELKNIDIKKINSILGGIWFEQYFYLAILKARDELKKEKNIDIDVGWSCKVKPTNEGKEFEIDIVASKGYSLYVFSLTTDNSIPISKSKFFEVVFRTNQMSGEFGKVTLVTFLSEEDKDSKEKVQKFKDDLTNFSTSVYSNAQVWGNKDVKDFNKLVEKIINRLEE